MLSAISSESQHSFTTTSGTTPKPTPAPAAPAGDVDPGAVDSSEATFTSEGSNIKVYLLKLKTNGTFPGLIIIHENRGLTDHIKDVARQYANQGYVVVAADLLVQQVAEKRVLAGISSGLMPLS